jgi:small-conductance mechanosensitive channel
MTGREFIVSRLEQLKAQRAQLQENLVQIQGNLSAHHGAITELELVLEQIGPAPAKRDETPDIKESSEPSIVTSLASRQRH